MSLNIIRKRERITTRSPFLRFDRGNGSGWSFDLDPETGIPMFGDKYVEGYGPKESYESGEDAGAINFVLCVMGWMPGIIGYEFGEYVNTYTEPAVGRCACGEEVYLENDYGHGIDCGNCHRIYNQSGQELAPRSQWEDRYSEESTQPYCVEFGYIGPGDEY